MEMKINEYVELTGRTDNDREDREYNYALGLIGELGEMAELIKKHVFHDHLADWKFKEELYKEIGDMMWYGARVSAHINKPLYNSLYDNTFQEVHTTSFTIEKQKDLPRFVIQLSRVINEVAWELKYGCDLEEHVVESRLNEMMLLLASIVSYFSTNFTLEDIAKQNIEKLKKRYPQGSSKEGSKNRVDVK